MVASHDPPPAPRAAESPRRPVVTGPQAGTGRATPPNGSRTRPPRLRHSGLSGRGSQPPPPRRDESEPTAGPFRAACSTSRRRRLDTPVAAVIEFLGTPLDRDRGLDIPHPFRLRTSIGRLDGSVSVASAEAVVRAFASEENLRHWCFCHAKPRRPAPPNSGPRVARARRTAPVRQVPPSAAESRAVLSPRRGGNSMRNWAWSGPRVQ